jgi:hypothetical protein
MSCKLIKNPRALNRQRQTPIIEDYSLVTPYAITRDVFEVSHCLDADRYRRFEDRLPDE